METTLVLLKPSCVQRQLIGEVLNRFERRGLRISGMKMMQLSDEILREHYAHLVDKPFFPSLQASMQASPVVALALTGVEAVKVVRQMAGVTNGREAAPRPISTVVGSANLELKFIRKKKSGVIDVALSHYDLFS